MEHRVVAHRAVTCNCVPLQFFGAIILRLQVAAELFSGISPVATEPPTRDHCTYWIFAGILLWGLDPLSPMTYNPKINVKTWLGSDPSLSRLDPSCCQASLERFWRRDSRISMPQIHNAGPFHCMVPTDTPPSPLATRGGCKSWPVTQNTPSKYIYVKSRIRIAPPERGLRMHSIRKENHCF